MLAAEVDVKLTKYASSRQSFNQIKSICQGLK
jgi:hypothetical protein